ncbi:hypothetical protein BCR34DRAFT_569260 [Clohesyomyces aquaticus]|uniref:Short-chain dehydrogenase n=1 Tax=Clohesyomyces aquaticus TaxID=1231657 RepID=A0A1Y1ZFC3_9PLEO|nr:hypothetical protein BCR34DRAFT_569260 [Clohesyomyces aquaticus]
MPGGDGTPGHMAKFIGAQLFGKTPKPTGSFAGQTVIITGSNTGLGFEAAKYAILLGCAKFIMAVRSVDKGEKAKAAIIQATGCDPKIIEIWTIDLTSYDSVKAFATRADRELERIDVLLENAAVASMEWNWVEDNERMVTVNVVSTFLLAFLMLPKLKATATKFNTKPRLTFVTSDTHFLVDFKEKDAQEGIFNRLNDKTKSLKNQSERYPTTKLMQVFLVREMAARLSSKESATVIINCTNPGLCHSELSRELDGIQIRVAKALLARSSEEGSRNLIAGAIGGLDTHGEYLDMGKVKTPATVVVGRGGAETQIRIYIELMEKLEKIAPGISGNL